MNMKKAFSHTVVFPKTVLLLMLIIIIIADLSALCEYDTIPPTAVMVDKFELVPSYAYVSFKVENSNGYFGDNYRSDNPFNHIDLLIVDAKNHTIPKKDTIGNFWTKLSYGIDTIGHPLPYTVHYKLNNDHLFYGGLTSLDMVIIQKFIMKLYKIQSLCARIRMDFNDDQNITVSDLMVFRWLILNYAPGLFDIIQAYDPDLKKWKKYFPMKIDEISDSIYSFVLLRKGDINFTGHYNFYCDYEGEVNDSLIQHYLSNDTVDINIEERKISDDGIYKLEYSNGGDKEINAFQISCVVDTNMIEILNVKIGDSIIPDYYYTTIKDTFIMTAINKKINYHDELFTVSVRARSPVLNDIHKFIEYGLSDSRLEVTTDEFYSSPVKLNYKNLTKTEDLGITGSITIVPNPFDNDLTLFTANYLSEDVRIRVFNSMGQQIKVINEFSNKNELVISGSDFPKQGIYLIMLEDKNTIISKKVIKR